MKDSVDEESRGRERDLDSLIGMELASASPAGAVIWKATGRERSVPAVVRFQVKRTDYRTTDVHATAEGVTLMIESKVPGGAYEPGQAESYGKDRRAGSVIAVTVGPEAFNGYFLQKRACFDAFVTIEDLARTLRDAAARPDIDPELAAAYRYRAERYDALARSMEPAPLEDVVAFGTLYRQLAKERSAGRVQVSHGSFRRGPRAEFAKGAPVRAPFRAMHKLRHEVLDVILVGWTLTQLEDLWSTLAETDKPANWDIATQLKSRPGKATGEPHPVLRYRVGAVREMSADGFAAAQGVIETVIDAVAAIGAWVDAHIPTTRGDYQSLVDRHLRRAAELAATHDPARADAIAQLLADESKR